MFCFKRLKHINTSVRTGNPNRQVLGALVWIPLLMCSCSSFLGLNRAEKPKPIANPFSEYHGLGSDYNQNMILRTKRGDRAVEVEIPGTSEKLSELILPVSPQFRDALRGPTSAGGDTEGNTDEKYKNHFPTASDVEITQSLPHGPPELDAQRESIERSLNLTPNDDEHSTSRTSSYLAGTDHIKQLYRQARYEAALLETDEMIKEYQTDPKLHEMRGTLLDRLGRRDLALKSWNQALRFNPNNASLKRFIERKPAGTQ